MRRARYLLLALFALPALGQQAPDPDLPGPLREVGFRQELGAQLPLDTVLRDENGDEVRLGGYFHQNRPVVLALVYYECPMICTMVWNGLSGSLRAVDFTPGEDYEVVIVSFDPREGPELAAAKKANYLREMGAEARADAFHFLTGNEESIAAVAEAIGFDYAWDEDTQQFAHATGITVLTQDGIVSRYLFGIEYAPKDLRLALVESAEGKIGGPVDQLLLFCFRYDPAVGRYGAAVMTLLRTGAILTVLGIVGFWWMMRRRSGQRRMGVNAGV